MASSKTRQICPKQPRIVDAFPSQIAYICTHPQLEEYDLSSVQIFSTGGSKTSPHYERLLFDKLTGLIFLNIVRRNWILLPFQKQLYLDMIIIPGLRPVRNGCLYKHATGKLSFSIWKKVSFYNSGQIICWFTRPFAYQPLNHWKDIFFLQAYRSLAVITKQDAISSKL